MLVGLTPPPMCATRHRLLSGEGPQPVALTVEARRYLGTVLWIKSAGIRLQDAAGRGCWLGWHQDGDVLRG